MDFFADKIADRLGGINFGKETVIYKFEKIKRAKAAAKAAHPELSLIDMGVGEPDRPAHPSIVAVLSAQAGLMENRQYADNGIEPYQQAAAAYLSRIYGITGLNPLEQIVHGIGSKPILALLPLCLINPGDVLLTTVPGYPVAATYTRYLGGEVYPLALTQSNNFFPDFKNIPQDILNRAKLLYINYPNNPTGQVANSSFYRDVVAFAYNHGVTVVQDAAYAGITFGTNPPLSFLSTPGALEVGAEIHSMSKAFDMTGWRLAFLAGNAKLVKAFATVKDNTDSGQFRAIQKAGIYALSHPEITQAACDRYERRFDALIPVLNSAGFTAKKPGGTFYCYVNAPIGTRNGLVFHNAEEAAAYLITHALISTVPWDDAGAYLRFSVTFEAEGPEQEQHIINEVGKRLVALELIF